MALQPAPHRIFRELSDADREKYDRMRGQLEEEKPELIAKARNWFQHRDAGVAILRDAIQQLKAERERQGLSLCELAERLRMFEADLCYLECDPACEPTLTVLVSYAEALGKKLEIGLADATAPVGQAAGQESG